MSTSRLLRLLAVLMIFAFGGRTMPGQAASDCITDPSTACDLNTTVTEIAPPDSPAFTILGLNPTNVSRPTSPTAIMADALTAFDDNGHFQSGTAIDFVPFLVFRAHSYSLGRYGDPGAKAYWTRLRSRSSLSFATTKGVSDADGALRLATGARIGIIDLSDPRAAFQKCVLKINMPIDPKHRELKPPGFDAAFKGCRDGAAKRVWNATSLIVAGAPSWISTDGSTKSLKLNGGGAWASFALGIKDSMQLTVNARRETGQNIVAPTTDGSSSSSGYVLQDTTLAGGSFRFGRGDFNGIVSGLYIGKRTDGAPDSYPEFGVGLEKKLTTNLYLDLNYRYDITSKNISGVLTNLKWSFGKAPALANGN